MLFKRYLFQLLLLVLLPVAARAQAVSPPTFYTTYSYLAYTVFDYTTDEPPTEVRGVGGSLLLRPNGTYEKRLSIVTPSGPHYFNQTGTFSLTGDSIRFAFTDLKGADVQRGTFRFDSVSRHLTLTILGYPTGNQGVYELVAADVPAAATTAPAVPTIKSRPAKTGKKRRR